MWVQLRNTNKDVKICVTLVLLLLVISSGCGPSSCLCTSGSVLLAQEAVRYMGLLSSHLPKRFLFIYLFSWVGAESVNCNSQEAIIEYTQHFSWECLCITDVWLKLSVQCQAFTAWTHRPRWFYMPEPLNTKYLQFEAVINLEAVIWEFFSVFILTFAVWANKMINLWVWTHSAPCALPNEENWFGHGCFICVFRTKQVTAF